MDMELAIMLLIVREPKLEIQQQVLIVGTTDMELDWVEMLV
jgi:hypothetical protein